MSTAATDSVPGGDDPQPSAPQDTPCSSRPQVRTIDNSHDSGYSTQSQSLDDASTSGQPLHAPQLSNKAVDGGKPRPLRPGLAAVDGLSEFDMPVDEATIARFNHLCSQVEKPLLEHVRGTLPWRKHVYRPIAIRLMVLGRTQEDAKPCIVILCMEHLSKKVQKFFDKDSIRALRQPDDETLPSFEVYVVGQPPKPKRGDGDIDVFSPVSIEERMRLDTYCGLPIFIKQPSVGKRCTLGGLISVTRPSGDLEVYGLTVGHILLDEKDGWTPSEPTVMTAWKPPLSTHLGSISRDNQPKARSSEAYRNDSRNSKSLVGLGTLTSGMF